MSSKSPDRRQFLKRLAATAYATPLFVTATAHAESAAFERAMSFLDKAREHVKAAERATSRENSMESLEAASTEIKQAQQAARQTQGDEQRRLSTEIRELSTEIRNLSRDR